MHGRVRLAGGLLAFLAVAMTSTSADRMNIAPGFTIRTANGLIDIGDIYIGVNHYDSAWKLTKQLDVFKPEQGKSPLDLKGAYATAAGPAELSQRVEAVDGGIHYTAAFGSAQPLGTNELSLALILPTATFSGRKVTVDGTSVTLPAEAAQKGASRIFDKADATVVEIDTPGGRLTVKGKFKFHLADDREWNDARYSMRLFFAPGSGEIREAHIDVTMTLAGLPAK